MATRRSRGDFVFDTVNVVLCCVIFTIVVYPLVYVLSASFSNPLAVLQGRMRLWPIDFRLWAYRDVFKHADIMVGYKNSLILVVLGTSTNIILTFIGA